MALVLWAFYRKFEDDWPLNYQSVSTPYDLVVRRNLLWHGIVRLGPVFVASLVTAGTANSWGLIPAAAVTTMIVAHLASTTVVAIWLAAHRLYRRFTVITYDLSLSAFLVLFTWLGYAAAARTPWLVPQPSAFRDGIWVALVVVILAKFFDRAGRMMHAHDVDLRKIAERDIGSDALAAIPNAARRHGANEALLRAIIYAEALQRTRSVRRLERVKGRFIPDGSYGVAQVKSDHPIDDASSIDQLAAMLSGSAWYLAHPNEPRTDIVDAYTELHSRDRDLRAHVRDSYEQILSDDSCLDESDERAVDGRPIIELVSVRREGFTFVITGTAWGLESADQLRVTTDEADDPIHVRLLETTARRGRWQAVIPIATNSMTITHLGETLEFEPANRLQD